MIESPVYKLRPPLRKPELISQKIAWSAPKAKPTVQLPSDSQKHGPSAVTEVMTETAASSSRIPPSPPNVVRTANTQGGREFVCRGCRKRAIGHLPFGWLRLLRAVDPDALPAGRLLVRRNRKGQIFYADQPVGSFCSLDCLQQCLSSAGLV
jgi:hypothetical protein